MTLSLEIETNEGEDLPELVARALRAVTSETASGTVTSSIPVGKGLGSSGACIAAGLVLGCAMEGRGCDPHELLRIGAPIEGHPDNLAASLFGGITLALPDGNVMRFDPAGGVRPMVLVPIERLSTEAARRVLPDDLPRADAIANVARSSGLISMLTGAAEATPERLLECTADLVHQPYRAPLMPRTTAAIEYLRGRGVAAAVSGAGPSVFCLTLRGREDHVRSASSELEGWDLLDVDWELEGARVVDDP